MVEIVTIEALDRFILRGGADCAIPLPIRPLHVASLNDASRNDVRLDHGAALWLGPDEWLVLLAQGAVPTLAERLAAGPAPLAVVDVSHRTIAFRLTGADAATLLNGAVPLDLSLAAFPVGTCARTVFDKTEIVLWRCADAEWHIEVARSFAPYLRDLLAAIAAADGIALATPRVAS